MPKAAKAKVGQNKKAVHPNSRKAQYLSRKCYRDMKISSAKSGRSKLDLLATKIAWFKDNLDEEKTSFIKADLCDLTHRYLQRFDEELEQIDIVSSVGARQGSQHASRKAAIKLTMDSDRNEVESCGIEVPDLVNKDTLKLITKWDGEMRLVQNFKMKKISKADLDKFKPIREDVDSSSDE